MSKAFHSILSVLTAVLLLFGTVPKDFMHGWTGHEDTIHAAHECGDPSGPVFETAHHHCEFMKLLVAPFCAPVTLPYYTLFFLEHTASVQHYSYVAESVHHSQRCLRGPPAA